MTNVDHKIKLRKELRQRRRSISKQESLRAAKDCCEIIIKQNILENKQNIAFYLSQDNELDLCFLLEYCLEHNKNCYLPVLDNTALKFAPYTHKSKLINNKYHIVEPLIEDPNSMLAAQNLDLVFVPLVAFTKSGNRLGMGGGHYDQTFAFLQNLTNHTNNNSTFIIKPILIGIAYELQCVSQLPIDSWDINLNGIVTESEYIKIQNEV